MLFDAIGPERGDALLRGVLPLLAVFGLLYALTLGLWLIFRPRREAASKAAKSAPALRTPARPAGAHFAVGPAPESATSRQEKWARRGRGTRVGSNNGLP